MELMKKTIGPRVLIFDIETKPIIGHVWSLWENNVSLNQIEEDWSVLSWSAKWHDKPEVMYQDNRRARDLADDKPLLQKIWDLLDQADVVVTQNGRAFDSKKLNARFVINKMNPPSSYKHIDLKILAKNKFGFTSNKLEYMTDKICTKYKKLKHKKFPGHELWTECMKGNAEAWDEMKQYNMHDVLSTEELWTKLRAWDNSVNFNLYTDDDQPDLCKCGGKWLRNGYAYTNVSKFQRFRCGSCGCECRGRDNLFSRRKKDSIKTRII